MYSPLAIHRGILKLVYRPSCVPQNSHCRRLLMHKTTPVPASSHNRCIPLLSGLNRPKTSISVKKTSWIRKPSTRFSGRDSREKALCIPRSAVAKTCAGTGRRFLTGQTCTDTDECYFAPMTFRICSWVPIGSTMRYITNSDQQASQATSTALMRFIRTLHQLGVFFIFLQTEQDKARLLGLPVLPIRSEIRGFPRINT
jgi:hypothetical protein